MLHKLLNYLSKNQVIFGLFLLASAWFLFQIKDILVSLFISYIIMSGILPVVDFLQKKKFPKFLAVFLPYIVIIGLIFLIVLPTIPFAVGQIESLAKDFPKILKTSADSLGMKIDPKSVQTYLNGNITSLGNNFIAVTTKVFGGIFSVLTIAVVSFYLLMYHNNFKKSFSKLFKHESRPHVLSTLYKIDEKLGAWLRGELFLMLFIGTLTWVIFTLLGVPFALPLAIVAGLLEIVPTLGPIIAAIPAAIVALTVSPLMVLLVTIAAIFIQAIENYLLVPNIMHKAVGLNPVVVILSIVIGANLMGVAGALLAIPFVSFLIVIIESINGEKS